MPAVGVALLCFAVLAAAALRPDLATAGDPPVAAYSFDAGAGELAEDLIGENDGELEGAEWFEKGKYGSALLFDGEETCVTVPHSSELQLNEELTLEAWVKPHYLSDQPVLYKSAWGNLGYALGISFYNTAKPEGLIGEGVGVYEDVVSPYAVEENVWSHLAFTYDGARMRLYVNGQLVGSQAQSTPPPTGEGPLAIGCNPLYPEDFDGLIDEVRIYDRAIDAGEIAADKGAALQTPSRDPVAAYSFDSGEGEVARDLFGGHDGELNTVDWVKGRFGSALYFDGNADYVEIADSADLQLTEEFTLEAWVRPDGVEDEGAVISKTAGGFFSYQLYGGAYESAGVPEGFLGYGPSAWEDVEDEEPLVAKTWNHLALTYDGATLRLYVNDQLVDTESSPAAQASVGPLYLGGNEDGEDFKGRIDEVRIYDRALDAGEIAADKGAPVQTPPSPPVAAYSFDAGEGEVAEDLAGENEGELENTEWVRGKYGSGLYFDGDGDDMVRIADSAELQLDEEFTLEAWVRPDSAQTEAPVIEKRTSGFYSYKLSAGGETAGLPEGFVADEDFSWEEVADEEALTSKAWSHLAMTYDGAAIRLYVDGELVDTNNAPGPQASTGDLLIGADDAEDAFKGRIDEVRIYDRALDAGEIAADKGAPVQTPPSAPVAAYSFDAGEGEVAEDLFGGHDGAIEGAEWFESGRYGSALLFDGSETCVTIPHAAELELGEEMTLEAWVKPHYLSDQPVLYKSAWGNLGYALGISFYNTAKPEGLIGEGVGVYEDVVSPYAVEENVWSHLAFTYDGARMRLYVNGELVATQAQSTPPPGGEGPLAIGCNPLYPEDFDGLIDEVRVYDRALGVDEVMADSRTWLEAPARGPVAAYSLDTGEGAVAEDLAGENDGAIEGASWFANGKYDKALSFDGVDDCVSIEDAAGLQLPEDFTLQAWVKPKGTGVDEPILSKETESYFSYALYLGLQASGRVEGLLGGEEEEIGPDVESDGALPINVWSHVAVTYDGARMRLYVNGELQDTAYAELGAFASSGPLQLGCSEAFEDNFKGLLDEPRLYDRALDEAEIRETMSAGFPVAITEAATEAGANDAILNGTANANGGDTEYFFEYGPTKSYGSVIVGEGLGRGREALEISEAIIDLEPETTYHYRLVAQSSAGTVYGKDQTVATGKPALLPPEEEELKEAENKTELTPSEKKAGPGNFYGMMWTGDLKKMRNQNIYEAVVRSGAKFMHIGISPYEDQEEIAYAFKVADENGMTVLPGIGGSAFPKPGPEREKWINYANGMVAKYGPGTSYDAKAWVIWNEPNMSHVDKIKDTPEPLKGELEAEVNPEAFAEFFGKMSAELRSVNNNVQILTPGLYGYRVGGCEPECHLTPRAFLKRMDKKLAELEYTDPYDAMAIHPYVFRIGKGGKKPTDAEDVKQVRNAIKRVITGLNRLHPAKPLWITELGFPVANPGNKAKAPPVSQYIQKLLVKASFAMLQNQRKRLNIARAIYYNIQDDEKLGWEYHSGLLKVQGTARPAWGSYSTLAGGEDCPHAPC